LSWRYPYGINLQLIMAGRNLFSMTKGRLVGLQQRQDDSVTFSSGERLFL
jgi:hypothetical protein